MKLALEMALTGQNRGSGAGGIVGLLANTVLGSLLGGGGIGGLHSTNPVYTGLYAEGGFIPPGGWGIAGERGPEPVFGGRTGLTVIPNSASKTSNTPTVNLTVNFNGQNATPRDRQSMTQVARQLTGMIEHNTRRGK